MTSNKFAKDQMGIFFYANPESCWPARKYNLSIILLVNMKVYLSAFCHF